MSLSAYHYDKAVFCNDHTTEKLNGLKLSRTIQNFDAIKDRLC